MNCGVQSYPPPTILTCIEAYLCQKKLQKKILVAFWLWVFSYYAIEMLVFVVT